MEIRIGGGRTTDEAWRIAHSTPVEKLPELNAEGKVAAAALGIKESEYARHLLAVKSGQQELEKKARKAALLVERTGSDKFANLHVHELWWDTMRGKFRFDLESEGRSDSISISEDLIDEVLESGLDSAVQRISRVLEFGLPEAWMLQAS